MTTQPSSLYALPFGLRLRIVHNGVQRRMLCRDSGYISFRRYPHGWLVRVLGVAIYKGDY